MSTRCNIVIKKSVKNGNSVVTDYQQIYHHHDGYPNCVGKELQEFAHKQFIGDLFMQQTPFDFATKLNETDKSYVLEDEICLHGDIEYLYIIDLNRMEIKCYKVDGNFIEECDDDISIINGDCPINEKSYCKIYTMGFDVETLTLKIGAKSDKETCISKICNDLLEKYDTTRGTAINMLYEILSANNNFLDLQKMSTNGFPETEVIFDKDCVDYIVGVRIKNSKIEFLLESRLNDDKNTATECLNDDDLWYDIKHFHGYPDIVVTILYFILCFDGNYIC